MADRIIRHAVLQAADPLTALKYAVQVMNFLNQLIERALRQRREQAVAATAKLIS
jgi:hypothetical protein